jgi:transposase
MIGVMVRHRVQVLREVGWTYRQIARETGVSVRAVRRICIEQPVEETTESEQAARRRVGRPSIVAPFRDRIEEILAGERELPTLEVLHRLRGAGYEGGKSALYEAVRELRPPKTVPMVRFEGVAGEFSQHDFGEVEVHYLNGTHERIRFFASRLKFSRWVDVQLVQNEKVESLVRSLLLGFESFGGVPLVAVFDNPKTVVINREGSRIIWNETFAQVALDYRFAPELCTPARGQEKGSVENLVGFVKGSFFKVRKFVDRADLEEQLRDWHREVNTARPCRATGVIPALRLQQEQERLRPLAIPPAEYPLRFSIMVGPTAMVYFEGHGYSLAPEAIGMPGMLWLYPDRVRIQARRYVAEHPRVPQQGKDSILPEHRAARLAQVSGERGRLYLKRQEILDLGPKAETFLTEIVHRHRFTWKTEVEDLHRALVQYGPVALYHHLTRACEQKLFGAQYVCLSLAQEVA